MIETPDIIQTEAQAAAVIHLTIARSEMMKEFGPAAGELMAALAAQGVQPLGAIFAHHLRMSRDAFDFELGVKIASPVKPAGRVKPGELPKVKAARTIYHGAYEGLPSAWGEFDNWLRANGHEQAGSLWEVYLAGPQSTPNPADWRSELVRPLKN